MEAASSASCSSFICDRVWKGLGSIRSRGISRGFPPSASAGEGTGAAGTCALGRSESSPFPNARRFVSVAMLVIGSFLVQARKPIGQQRRLSKYGRVWFASLSGVGPEAYFALGPMIGGLLSLQAARTLDLVAGQEFANQFEVGFGSP